MCKPCRATHPPSRPSDPFRMLPTLLPTPFFHQERMAQSVFGTSAQALPHFAVSLRPSPLTEMYLPLNREYDAFCLSQHHNTCSFNISWIFRLMNAPAVTVSSDCIRRWKHPWTALL